MTKLCRSIAVQGLDNILKLTEGAEMAEIRLEKSGLTLEEVRQLFAGQKNLLATCRPDGLTPKQQTCILQTAIENGAEWVDVEIEADEEYRQNIVRYAHKYGCKIIVSYHNYAETPSFAELMQIADLAHSMGADLVKLACQCNERNDVLNLLNLYKLNYKILAIGMGDLGAVTRISAITFNAPFTFVSLKGVEKTASGQIDEEIMKMFRK